MLRRTTRLELRAADAAANPYLVIAANLFAGLDGIQRELDLPPADITHGAESAGRALPSSLDESLQALRADDLLVRAIGAPIVDAFCALKTLEAERFRRAVTEWEINEYAWHL